MSTPGITPCSLVEVYGHCRLLASTAYSSTWKMDAISSFEIPDYIASFKSGHRPLTYHTKFQRNPLSTYAQRAMSAYEQLTYKLGNKTAPPTVLPCPIAKVFTEPLPSNERRNTQTQASQITLFVRVSAAAGTCLPSRCLAMKGGINIQTHRLIIRIYEVTYIPIFIKICSGTQKLIGGGGS
jgi:hypothetical protein